MDDKYIEMCREAKEIQNNWKPKPGDAILDLDVINADSEFVTEYDIIDMDKCLHGNFFEGYVWLPRQEDLQKIYMENQDCNMEYMTLRLRDWLHDKWLHYNSALNDILPDEDQFYILDWNTLWLCFVMETCYNKAWNGKTWIRSD